MITPCTETGCTWKSWSDHPNIKAHILQWHKGLKRPRGTNISLLSTPSLEKPLNNRGAR